MCSRRVQPFPWFRIALLIFLTLLVSAWGTCNAMVSFNSCEAFGPMAQLTSLSLQAIAGDSESSLLSVDGMGFTAQSQILWNGNALSTSFIDSQHLQTTITPQILASFRGSPGRTVQVSVGTRGSGVGCPVNANSAALNLVIQ